MPKNKIHRAAVLSAQNTTCPACGYKIPPAEILRVSTQEMKCPKCGDVFVPGKTTGAGVTARRLAASSRRGGKSAEWFWVW